MEGGGVDARALDGLPGGLQEEPLLGVDGEGFTRGDAEEGGVEAVGAVEEAAGPGVDSAGLVRVGVEEGGEVPAPVLGEGADGVAGGGGQLPQGLGGVGAAGQAAAGADHGDRLVGAVVLVLQAALGLAELARHPLEVVEQLLVIRHGNSPTQDRSQRRCPLVSRTVRARSPGPGRCASPDAARHTRWCAARLQ